MTLLPWVVFLPLIAGAIGFAVAPRADKLRELGATVIAAVVFVLSILVLLGPEYAYRAVPLSFTDGYLIDLRMDVLNRFMVVFASLFGFLIAVFSIGYMKGRPRLREYYPYLLLSIGAANGALLANNWLLFVSFWGFILVTLFLLTTIGTQNAAPARVLRAAGKSILILGAADLALILGVGLIFLQTGTLTMSGTSLPATGALSVAAFILVLVGALSKAGAMPVHSWIPDMAEVAPMSAMALLPASIDKLLGIYLLARLVLDVFAVTLALNVLLMVIGTITIVAGVVMALVQHDVRKLLSFHAISQVGYMVLGIGTGTAIGIAGAVFHMLNNAVYKSSLFLTAGAVEKQAGTTDSAHLGGLARVMPFTFVTFAVAALAISGIPPFNGFVSKWMVYQGIVEAGIGNYWPFLVAAMFGSALTLASFVKFAHAVFLGDSPRGLSGVREVGASMRVGPAVLATLCVLFGVVAQIPLVYFIGPAVGLQFPGFPEAISITGLWSPTAGSLLLVFALLIGYGIYLLSKPRTIRNVTAYLGGETSGEGSGESLSTPYGRMRGTVDTRVLGTQFYDNIRQYPGLMTLYNWGEKGRFDIQRLATLVPPVGRALSSLHTGRLSTYVAWVVLAVVVVLIVALLAL